MNAHKQTITVNSKREIIKTKGPKYSWKRPTKDKENTAEKKHQTNQTHTTRPKMIPRLEQGSKKKKWSTKKQNNPTQKRTEQA